MSDPLTPMEPLEQAAALERIAGHISETLYYASSALHKAHTKADEKFIRHDDYDELRRIARQIKAEEYERLAEEARRG